MIRRIDHIEIIVRNVEEFVTVFSKLGFQLITRTRHHGESAEMKLPGDDQPTIEIHKVGGEENIGVNHIAFLVDDIETTYRNLSDNGIEFEGETQRIGPTGRTIANFRDPDGWRLQLVDSRRTKPANPNPVDKDDT